MFLEIFQIEVINKRYTSGRVQGSVNFVSVARDYTTGKLKLISIGPLVRFVLSF